MATRDQITALVRSHVERDDDRFYALAMQVAAHETNLGHERIAEEIRSLLNRKRLPIAASKGVTAGLIAPSTPVAKLGDLVLDPVLRRKLERVLAEQRAADKLLSHGLVPARKILLVGPPGTGKTLTASALAGELGLPLYKIALHAVIGGFLGETASKLRMVFDSLEEHVGVYLFDEFDAIGTERGASQDVGEMRRVLASFLQFIEQDQSRGLIIAATNHGRALDTALFRRFDLVAEYGMPDGQAVEDLIRLRLASFEVGAIDWKMTRDAAEGLSYAEVDAACDVAAKDAVLRDAAMITTASLTAALEARQRP